MSCIYLIGQGYNHIEIIHIGIIGSVHNFV